MRLLSVEIRFANGDIEAFDATPELAARYGQAVITKGGRSLIDAVLDRAFQTPPRGVTFVHVNERGTTTGRWVPYA